MKIENFEQQNEFNEKIFEILQNHFTYEEQSRKMITDLSASIAQSTKAMTKIASSMSGRQIRLTIAFVAVGAFTVKKYRDLEKRVEKLEEAR